MREPAQYPGEDGPLWQAALLWVAFLVVLYVVLWLASGLYRVITS